MIVANREASITTANEISNKLLTVINEETKNFICEDDPAENVYLAVHTAGSLVAKIAIALENYGGIYDIKKLNPAAAVAWIVGIAEEHIKMNGKRDAVE